MQNLLNNFTIKELLLDPIDKQNNTSLNLAIIGNDESEVENMLKQNATSGKDRIYLGQLPRNKSGLNALDLAIKQNNAKIQHMLAEYFIKDIYPEIFEALNNIYQEYGNNSSLLLLTLDAATNSASMELLKNILDIYPLYINKTFDEKLNVLAYSFLYYKLSPIIKKTLKFPTLNPSFINEEYSFLEGGTPISFAARSRDFEIVNILLEHKDFNPESIDKTDKNGYSLVYYSMIGALEGSCDFELLDKILNLSQNPNNMQNFLFNLIGSDSYSLTNNKDKTSKVKERLLSLLEKEKISFLPKELDLQNNLLYYSFAGNKDEVILCLNKFHPLYHIQLKLDDFITLLNQSLLIAFHNDNFELVDIIKCKLNEVIDSNEFFLKLLNYKAHSYGIITGINEQLTTELEGAQKLQDILQNIIILFTQVEVRNKTLGVVEQLLSESISPGNLTKLLEAKYECEIYVNSLIYYNKQPNDNTQLNLDSIFDKILYAILNIHGFSSRRLYFIHYVPSNIAGIIALEHMFQERLSLNSVAHGRKTHLIQIVMLCIAIDLGFINLPPNFTGQSLVTLIIQYSKIFKLGYFYPCDNIIRPIKNMQEVGLWDVMFDSTDLFYSPDHPPFNQPEAMNSWLMSQTEFPIIAALTRRNCASSVDKLTNIINKRLINNNQQQITPKAIASAASPFQKSINFNPKITNEEIEEYNKNSKHIIKYEDDARGKHIIIEKISNESFARGVIEQRKNYEKIVKT